VTGEALRALMRSFPTGVVAVTALAADGPVGLLVGSFFSVSLCPAQVGFCVGVDSTSWPLVRASDRFAVSLLAAGQERVGVALARPGSGKFDGVAWHEADAGVPVIDGALAYLECACAAEHRAGDHWIVVADVRRTRVLRRADPLVYYRRGFATVGGPEPESAS